MLLWPVQLAAPKLARSRHLDHLGSSRVRIGGIFTVDCSSGFVVSNRPLAGRVILVVEDEPLLALEMDKALRVAGAKVVSAGFLESGLCSTEHPQLAAAVVDLHLGDGNGTALCRRLRQLGVPFVVHTGYPLMVTEREWSGATVIYKPAHPDRIVAALVQLLA